MNDPVFSLLLKTFWNRNSSLLNQESTRLQSIGCVIHTTAISIQYLLRFSNVNSIITFTQRSTHIQPESKLIMNIKHGMYASITNLIY